MYRILALTFLFLALSSITTAYARGGQSADDCPVGSTDPDCVKAASQGK